MLKTFITVIALLVPGSVALMAQTAAPAYKAPRLTGTARPNLNGLWESVNEGNASEH